MRTLSRHIAAVGLAGALLATAGCTAGTPTEDRPVIPLTTGLTPDADTVDIAAGSSAEAIDDAVATALAQLPGLAQAALDESGVPGLAVAVVHGDETVYSAGFGTKLVGTDDPVGDETVFQIASVSKSISATTVAKAITDEVITWDTPVAEAMPEFEMSDPYVTAHATVGDYFSHRSGLATGAGDDLEDIGYDRAYILSHLHLQPLDAFRSSYNYSNFGITVGAEATARSLGMSWEDAVDALVYEPLGMTSSSSRYADYVAAPDKAILHAYVDGAFEALYDRDPDPQSPAGGVSSNVVDLARWMRVILAGGTSDGAPYIDEAPLRAATTGQQVSGHPPVVESRTSMYGFGFNVGSQPGGRTAISHSGAFVLGAGTNVLMIPSLDVGIVTLTNGGPVGVAEALNAEFMDLVQFGQIRRDWLGDYFGALAPYNTPVGDLVDAEEPANPAAPDAPSAYTGTWENPYFGPLEVSEAGGALTAALGPDGGYTVALDAWDGDVFAFTPTGENAPAGSRSSATFDLDAGTLTLDFFDGQGLGTWTMTP